MSPKPPSSFRSLRPASRMLPDDCVLRVGERGGLLQDLVGAAQLADVVEKPADREAAELRRGEAELLPHLHGAKRDAAGVLLRVLVLLREIDEERTDLRAEECLFRRDEVCAAQVAHERPRGHGAHEVRRDGIPTSAMPTISNPWPSHQPSSMNPSRSEAASALTSQTRPTTTVRSERRCVRRYVRSARMMSRQ